MINISTLDIISKLLKEQHQTQKMLCEYLGLSKNAYTDWKSGHMKSYERYLPKIADFLGVSVDELLGKEKKPINIDELYPNEGIEYFDVVGSVKAGYDGIAVEDYTGEKEPIPTQFLKGHSKDEFFLLRVKGLSMHPRFFDGDLVLVQRTTSVDSGTIAVVLYNGDEATVKKVEYVPGGDYIDLVPINPEFATKRIKSSELDQCRILGAVVKLIRDI